MIKNYSFILTLLILATTCGFNLKAQDASVEGSWSDPIGFGIVPVAVANLPDGRLITWSSQFRDTYVATGDGATFTEIFDPFLGSDGQALGEFVTNTDHDMFCPGINNLADGRILSAGGTSSERTSIYDPTTGLWSVAAEMNIPRGYQGNVTLSDGTVFTLGGSWGGGNNSSTNGGKDAELWSPETGWLLLPGITGEDIYNSNDLSRETEGVFRVDNHLWLWPASNGRVFHAGPSEMMHWIDVDGAGSIEDVGLRSNDTYSMKGTTVMFDVDRILKVGGAESYGSDNPAKDNSFVIDFSNENNVTVTPTVNNLFLSRTMHNSTVLPNGEILVTGGLDHAEVFTDDGSRLTAEIYNPSSNSWRQVAGMQIPRTYHSVAILMVDGRVFVGGGGLCDDSNPDECVNHFDAEVYSPPYLFNGDGSLATRPTISAPDTADYNTSINVTGSTGIQEFSLIRFSAATHSTNNEQRRIPVSFSGNGNYSVNIPERNLLPPGYYMLFALDSNGVPSVAETIQIGSAIPLPENPTLVLDLNFDDGSGSTVSDASSYSNDATIFDVDDAGATKIPSTDNWGTGLFGGALETDGFEFESNTIVDVPYSASMATVENAITIMAWVSRDEIVNNASIFTHDYPALFFGFHNSLYKWEIYTPGGNAGASCLASYTPEDTWVHIAATFDGETAKLFANGIEICSKPYSGSLNLNPSEPNFSSFTASGFYERRTNPASNYNDSGVTDELDGRIDALKVFNRALSGDEILPYYQEGEGLSTVPDCPDGTIVAEYRINDQDWQTGTVMNVAEGDIVYIRARDYSAGEYFVTVPQAYAPTFSSVDDLEGSTFNAYQVDTGEPGLGFPDGDGIVDSNNVGQYVLTTAGGCIAVLDLQINCTNESIIPEYRLDGVWSSGENELTVVEGTEVMFSMLPNDIEVTVTFPDGTVVGDDYDIGPVTVANAGIYTIRSIQGCSTTVDLTVTTFDCASFGLETEYSIDGGTAVTGATTATVEEGADLLLSIIPNGVPYSISGPNGNNKPLDISDLTITGISQDDSGVYTFITEDGCITTLDITISCSPESIIPEYNLDGQWFSGGSEINVIEGTEIILSMLPNEIDLVITLPDGSEVGDDYELGAVTSADAGTYTLRSEDGCVTTLDINVSTFDCAILGLESSYNLNGGGAVTGATTLRVNEGDNLEISLLPPGLAYSISGPNDMIKPTNTASYTFTGIGPTEGGLYTFRTEDGCTLDFEIIVDCVPGSIIAEYNLNGVWFSGEDSITIEEGTVVILSMLPNFIDVDITLPDGTVVGDNYELGSVTAADSGIYTFVSEEGCQTSLEIIVTTDTDCDTLGLEAAYSVNGGTIVSGENSLEVVEGDDLSLSINPTGIAYSISGPNGNNKPLNTLALDLTAVVLADAGTYTFMTAEGCMVALDLTVVEGEPSCEEQNLETEYSLNGQTAITGASSITIDEGDTISLGIIPDDIAFSVSGPNSKALGLEDLLLSEVNLTDAGTYTFTTDAGCELSLQIVINPIVDPGPDCSALGLAVEYGINDENLVTGASKVSLFVGDDLLLSIIPDGIAFSISGVNGNNKTLDNTDLTLESVILEDAGIYTFTTEEGCEVALEVEIVAPEVPTSGNLEDIEVFPIPLTSKDPATRGILNVVLSDFMNEPIQFYVFDIYGKQALSKAVGSDHSETEQLDLSSLSSGFYLLDIQRVNVDEQTYKKIIKVN